MITSKQDILIEHPKDKDTGDEIPEVFLVHTDRNLGLLAHGGLKGFEGFGQHVVKIIGGIDGMKQLGIYSFQVLVAQCFEPKDVEEAILGALKTFRSDIELPSTELSLIKP